MHQRRSKPARQMLTAPGEGVVARIVFMQQRPKEALFDYIEVFYNQRRRHSTLGQISPAAFERRTATQAA